MLKHVHISPCRSRADSMSLCSSTSHSSLGGSPPEALSSRSSSYSSLNEAIPNTAAIKVYARCLRPDIEYKTLSITFSTTSYEVIQALLAKFRMRHKDPKLFYLTMEVAVRRAGIRSTLVLDDDARPAELQSCHPKGDSRFALQARQGGLVKIYDGVLMTGSQYKSLHISEKTTVDDLVQILLNCYNSKERKELFSIYVVRPSEEFQRKLHHEDLPLQVQQSWGSNSDAHFRLHRNPDRHRPRRKLGLQEQWCSDLGLPSPTTQPHLLRTFEHQLPPALPRRDPSGLLRQQQPIRAHISNVPIRHYVQTTTNIINSSLFNNNNYKSRSSRSSAILEETIPHFQALQIAKPVHSYKEYENYLFI
ncbi:uncharacterized protein LOC132203004 [Neocloeon triangulifer]|uniref:uncharacterized protein LOC132203004 n=1 Tax=Neocloeon triangulifer TaxID=2078957 RepID=UPI00286FA8E3|nr:uncharacterized protein LOC132203004 [Neocloeon triangulifer]